MIPHILSDYGQLRQQQSHILHACTYTRMHRHFICMPACCCMLIQHLMHSLCSGPLSQHWDNHTTLQTNSQLCSPLFTKQQGAVTYQHMANRLRDKAKKRKKITLLNRLSSSVCFNCNKNALIFHYL